MIATIENRTHAKAELLRKKREFLMPCYYAFYEEPLWIVRAEEEWVFDETGRRYLDAYSGVGVTNCGHANPEIDEAVRDASVDHVTSIYLTEPMIRLAERLAERAPGGLKKVFFCSSGSEANETATLLATLATGRRRFIAFDAGLHGRTLLTMNLTGLSMWRTDPSLSDRVLHLPTPDCHRCPFGKERATCGLECASRAAQRIEEEGPENFAAMIAEPVLGNGGIVVPPDGYFKALEPTLRRRGILLIADEMQTGFGRTGKWFGIEHHGAAPDIMTMAKALGNGVPVGAAIAADEVAAAYARPGASTFGGNGRSMAAGLAVLDFMERRRLPDRAQKLGAWLMKHLSRLQRRHWAAGHVRGLGLMLGMEIVHQNGMENPELADRILTAMKERGFLIGKTGNRRNVLTFMPPLTVSRAALEALVENLDQALTTAGDAP